MESNSLIDGELVNGTVLISANDSVDFHKQYSIKTRHWFSVATNYGDIKIGLLPHGSENVNENGLYVLDAAHSLERDEIILRSIEDWMNIPLDVTYSQYMLPNDNVSVLVSLKNGFEGNTAKNIIVSLPISMLITLNNPKTVESLPINTDWQDVSCNLCLAEISLQEDNIQQLEAGSMLLIPNSFSCSWPCKILLNNNDLRLPLVLLASLDKKEFSLRFKGNAGSCNQVLKKEKSLSTKIISLSIELDSLLSIDVDSLMGWSADSTHFLTQSMSSSVLPSVVIKHQENPIGFGHLLSVADGFGVLLDSFSCSAL